MALQSVARQPLSFLTQQNSLQTFATADSIIDNRLEHYTVRNLHHDDRISRSNDMKRYILIHLIIFAAMATAWAFVGISEPQKRKPKAQTLTLIFLGDTLTPQLPSALLGRLAAPDAESYNALRNKMLRSNYAPLISYLDHYCTARRACDWCRYLLVRTISEAAIPDTQSDERIALQIFLLERMGFDARAAQQGERLVMLLPFDGTVYERGYITINGQRFYVFEYGSAPEGYAPITHADAEPRRPLSIEIGAGIDSHIRPQSACLFGADISGRRLPSPFRVRGSNLCVNIRQPRRRHFIVPRSQPRSAAPFCHCSLSKLPRCRNSMRRNIYWDWCNTDLSSRAIVIFLDAINR